MENQYLFIHNPLGEMIPLAEVFIGIGYAYVINMKGFSNGFIDN